MATATCTCGWSGTYANKASAARYKRQHRCDAYRPRSRRAPEPAHGTYARYVSQHFRCRCAPCCRAQRHYQERRKLDILAGHARTVPAIGTVRRVQALMAAGWQGDAIAARVGVTRQNLPVHMRYPRVSVRLADATRRLFDEWSMQPGPSERTRSRALNSGFLPPEWWADVDIDDADALPITPDEDDVIVDEVVIERLLAGESVEHVSTAERDEAARRMLAADVEPTIVGRRLHIGVTTVARFAAQVAAESQRAA
jgi:hypothetical protein